MFFLLRAAFWLAVVFMLLPAGTIGHPEALLAAWSKAQVSTAQVSTAPTPNLAQEGTVSGASRLSEVAGSLTVRAGAACVAHPNACRQGLQAATRLTDSLRAGFDLVDSRRAAVVTR